jgi:hypothetical protein
MFPQQCLKIQSRFPRDASISGNTESAPTHCDLTPLHAAASITSHTLRPNAASCVCAHHHSNLTLLPVVLPFTTPITGRCLLLSIGALHQVVSCKQCFGGLACCCRCCTTGCGAAICSIRSPRRRGRKVSLRDRALVLEVTDCIGTMDVARSLIIGPCSILCAIKGAEPLALCTVWVPDLGCVPERAELLERCTWKIESSDNRIGVFRRGNQSPISQLPSCKRNVENVYSNTCLAKLGQTLHLSHGPNSI